MAEIVDTTTPLRGEDLTGRSFGKITVVRFGGRDKWGKKVWHCRCSCGTERAIRNSGLKDILSCGCLTLEIVGDAHRRHGMSHTPIHNHWHWMKQRCNNPGHADFPRYGGRGIIVEEPWQSSFEAFYADMGGGWSKGLTIERKNVNGPYCRDNCTWATRKAQGRNKRNTPFIEYGGVNRSCSEWDEVLGFPAGTTIIRKKAGWSAADTITKPLRKYIHKIPPNAMDVEFI